MSRVRVIVMALLLLIVFVASVWLMRVRDGASRPLVAVLTQQIGPRAPEGTRVRVQVLNTTRTRGLARRATRLLRDRGFDVVDMGTTGPTIDTTLVLDRSGHAAWAASVAALLRPARAVARPDSSRYLDITVLLGRTWHPPAEPLNP